MPTAPTSWHYQLDGSAPDLGGSFNDYAADLALDGAGNVVAAGSTRNTGTKQDLQSREARQRRRVADLDPDGRFGDA